MRGPMRRWNGSPANFSLAALQGYADRKLAAAGASSKIDVHHAYLPDLLINSTVRFRYDHPGQGALDMLCTVSNTEVALDPVALCRSMLREVVG